MHHHGNALDVLNLVLLWLLVVAPAVAARPPLPQLEQPRPTEPDTLERVLRDCDVSTWQRRPY